MTTISLIVNNTDIEVFGMIIEPDYEVGIMDFDLEIHDIMHEGKSIYELLSDSLINETITPMCIKLYKEREESDKLKEN